MSRNKNFFQSLQLIRYDKRSKVTTTQRNDIDFQPDYFFSTTLNPFLECYFNYSWSKLNRAFGINLSTFYERSEKTIFFTYMKEVDENLTEKVKFMRYNDPACFREMEIRFAFTESMEFNLSQISKDKCREICEKWGLLDLAIQIHRLERNSFSDLNFLFLDMPKQEDHVKEDFKGVIPLVEEYDNKIVNLAEKIVKLYE